MNYCQGLHMSYTLSYTEPTIVPRTVIFMLSPIQRIIFECDCAVDNESGLFDDRTSLMGAVLQLYLCVFSILYLYCLYSVFVLYVMGTITILVSSQLPVMWQRAASNRSQSDETPRLRGAGFLLLIKTTHRHHHHNRSHVQRKFHNFLQLFNLAHFL